MTAKSIRDVSRRVAAGSAVALLLTFLAYRFHFNLGSATSLHLFLVATIALRWGFLEASIISLLSVVCLDYFFTKLLFEFYMCDPHDWVALGTFEAAALLVSSLSNQVSRHAREAEMHRAQLQKLYELSEQILLLDHKEPVEQQLANLIRANLDVRGVAVWNTYEVNLGKSGEFDVSDDECTLAT